MKEKKKQDKGSDMHQLDDSMVVMGSKNMEKLLSKKKGHKKLGGGMNNLKKNKLAIAFNNLELE